MIRPACAHPLATILPEVVVREIARVAFEPHPIAQLLNDHYAAFPWVGPALKLRREMCPKGEPYIIDILLGPNDYGIENCHKCGSCLRAREHDLRCEYDVGVMMYEMYGGYDWYDLY